MEQQLLLFISESEPTEEAPSPFLPGTNIQYAWDATSLEWLKRCPRLYQYSMIEGWRPNDESVHIRFGSEFHQAYHAYSGLVNEGYNHDEALHRVVWDLLVRTGDWRPDHKYKNRNNLVRTVIWYLDKYENDPAATFIMENGDPAVEVSFRFELDWGPIQYDARMNDEAGQPYILCGHLDRVVEFNNNLFVMDHKTTTSTPGEYYFNQFEPNNQMTLYTIAAQIIYQSPIKGVIINTLQVAIDFTRCSRGFTYRTQDKLDEWLRDLRFWLLQAEEYARKGYWPMNDTACDKYGGCKFREICSKSPSVRHQFLKSSFTQEERWNPLIPR